MERTPERHEVVVIGAGQCGLAAANGLASRGIEFVVLEANERVGDNWRAQYDSLRLYSPAKYDALPDLPMPLPSNAYPTGRDMADYLEAYADQRRLPISTGVRVEDLRAKGGPGSGFVITAADRTLEASQVVIAAGAFRVPMTPAFAAGIDPAIVQLHSTDYRRPSQLAPGPVLIVGHGHAGADIAMEAAAAGHPTTLSGTGHGQLPWSVDSLAGRLAWPAMRFVAMNLLTLGTPIGRRMAPKVRKGGAPQLRHRRSDLLRAGVDLVDARTVGMRDGKPLLADGRVLDVANVIWATGLRPDYSWIRLPILDEEGWPKHDRGVVTSAPGLYFLGLVFQFGFTSMLIVGAARDAAYVVDRIAKRAARVAPAAKTSAAAGAAS